jgi:hypothetical protein
MRKSETPDIYNHFDEEYKRGCHGGECAAEENVAALPKVEPSLSCSDIYLICSMQPNKQAMVRLSDN